MRSNSRGDIIALWMRGYLRAIPTSKLGLLWLGLFFYSIVVPTSIAWERGFIMGFNFCFLIGALVIATKIAYDSGAYCIGGFFVFGCSYISKVLP